MGSLLDIIARGGIPQFNEQRAANDASARSQAELSQTNVQTAGLQQQQAIQQQQLRDQDIIRRAFSQSPQDPFSFAIKGGISGKGAYELQQHLLDLRTKAATLDKEKLANEQTQHQRLGEILQAVQQAGPEGSPERATAYQQAAPEMQQLAPDHPWNQIQPSDQQVRFLLGTHGYTKNLLDQAKTQQDIAASQAAMAGAQATADNTRATTAKTLAETPGVAAKSRMEVRQADAAESMDPKSIEGRVSMAIDPAKYPEEYKRTVAAASAALSSGLGPKEVEAAIKDGGDRIGRLQAGIAQAQATAPTKIQVMQAGVHARGAASTPSQDALEMMAEDALSGKPPSSRNPVLYSKVYDRAAEIAKERGMTAAQALMERNAAHAAQGSLNTLTKQYETLKPFAEMAEKNANVLEKAVNNLSDLGAPALNTPLRSLQQRFGGSPKVAAFTAAIQPVQADFARILNSPTGSGVLSDHAKAEMQKAIDPGATPAQLKAALDIFRTDAKNRRDSYEASIADLKGRTVAGAKPAQAAQQSAGGLVQVKDPRGKVHTFPNQQAADNFKKAAGIQ